VNALKTLLRSLIKFGGGCLVVLASWSAFHSFSYGFDFVLYPSVVAYSRFGVPIMWSVAFVLDASLVYMYTYRNRDLFGFDTIGRWKEYKGHAWWPFVRAKILKMGDPLVYLFFSVFENPFLATVYVRKTDKTRKGMDRRDWILFMTSYVISNLVWTFVSVQVASLTRSFWHHVAILVTGIFNHHFGFQA